MDRQRDGELREEPAQHKFKIQMYDFSCEDLCFPGGSSAEKFEPYLRIDFDMFKVFQTVHETNCENPEWGFKAGFQYVIRYLERLRDRHLRVQCCNKVSGQVVGEASIDLRTLACGPSHYQLTLTDPTGREDSCGVLKFTCVMRMLSSVTVILRNLKLTMQGCAAPARLNVSTTLENEVDGRGALELHLPHSLEGVWSGPFSLNITTTLNDMLKAPTQESLKFVVIDEMGMRQGEASLEFRKSFNNKVDTEIAFKTSVTYSCPLEGEEKFENVGTVGDLEGCVLYENLPLYGQMPSGRYVDGDVVGGMWLFDGLPFPQSMAQPPPLWEPERAGLEALITALDRETTTTRETVAGGDMQPNEEHETNLDDIDDGTFQEALEQIDLPPPWEKRRERAGDRTRIYYVDPRSRRTTWKDPRFLPENWDQRIDAATGKVYFHYHKTRENTYVDPRGCPPSWDPRLSKGGEVYFAYMPAKRASFVDPRGLPEGIEPALDDFGRMYFKCHSSRTTFWEDPREDEQEVTLTKWRHAQFTRWWKEQVWKEIEELQKHRAELDGELEATADAVQG